MSRRSLIDTGTPSSGPSGATSRHRFSEATAAAELRKALVELYRADGSLLDRLGISAGDDEPAPEDD